MTWLPAVGDEDLVSQAVDVARAVDAGADVSPAVVPLLRAIASTRSEAQRHELARQAQERAGHLGDVALQVLRVGVFLLA